jgi:predicted cobalt transporter CbtA
MTILLYVAMALAMLASMVGTPTPETASTPAPARTAR